MPHESQWLTAEEAAAHLKVKTRCLLRWVRLGNLQAYTLSGTKRHVWRFRKEDLDAALLSKPVLGTIRELPSRASAEKAAEPFRRMLAKPIKTVPMVSALVEQFKVERMSTRASTSHSVKAWLRNHIVPQWETIRSPIFRPGLLICG